MNVKKWILACAPFTMLSVPAHAQFFTGHTANSTHFSGNLYSGPQGFGAGFANGLNGALANAPSDGPAMGSYTPGVINGPDRQLQFEVQISMRGGGARAFDPVRRERFSGVYTVTSDGLFSAQTTVSLIGDRGSRLSCDVEMHRGDVPTGSGDCTDRKHTRYHLQF
jgi:hypothetical protein